METLCRVDFIPSQGLWIWIWPLRCDLSFASKHFSVDLTSIPEGEALSCWKKPKRTLNRKNFSHTFKAHLWPHWIRMFFLRDIHNILCTNFIKPLLRIRIKVVRIRILLFTLMQIRILLFTLMRIRSGSYLSLWCGSGSYHLLFSRLGPSKAPKCSSRSSFLKWCGSESADRSTDFNYKFCHVFQNKFQVSFRGCMSESPLVSNSKYELCVLLLGTNNSRQLRRRAIHLQHCPGLQSVCR